MYCRLWLSCHHHCVSSSLHVGHTCTLCGVQCTCGDYYSYRLWAYDNNISKSYTHYAFLISSSKVA
jgi:hypothetical protein